MSAALPDVKVFLACNLEPATNRPMRRVRRAWQSIYEVEVSFDPEGLTDRAWTMLRAAGRVFTTLLDNDDLTPTLHKRRKAVSLMEAADMLAKDEAERARFRARAEAYTNAYGEVSCGAKVEPFAHIAPLATPDDLRDATDYLNRLAETQGLGVRSAFHEPIVWLDDHVVDVGAAPWQIMLRAA